MTERAPLLLTGVTGQVGHELLSLLRPLGPVVAPLRGELDLSHPATVREVVLRVRPRWIVNAAAYTAVDKAETEPEAAFAINAEAVRALGEAAAELGVPVLHFSTDYVFSGIGDRPWTEDDATGPLGVYGASKLAGEQALAASGAPYLIFRTSWVYGTFGKNFLRTILRFARERPELRIVDDQFGAPTWARELAHLVVHTIARCEAQAGAQSGARAGAQTGYSPEALTEFVSGLSGVYHAAGSGFTSWFGFAEEFVRRAREAEPEQPWAKLQPVPSTEYPTPARRPANSRLDCSKIDRVLGFRMPEWQVSTAAVMRELAESAPIATSSASGSKPAAQS